MFGTPDIKTEKVPEPSIPLVGESKTVHAEHRRERPAGGRSAAGRGVDEDANSPLPTSVRPRQGGNPGP